MDDRANTSTAQNAGFECWGGLEFGRTGLIQVFQFWGRQLQPLAGVVGIHTFQPCPYRLAHWLVVLHFSSHQLYGGRVPWGCAENGQFV